MNSPTLMLTLFKTVCILKKPVNRYYENIFEDKRHYIMISTFKLLVLNF